MRIQRCVAAIDRPAGHFHPPRSAADGRGRYVDEIRDLVRIGMGISTRYELRQSSPSSGSR